MQPDGPPRQQVDRANGEVAKLYRAGKYHEAVQLAKQVVEFARGHLGGDHPDFAAFLDEAGIDSMSVTPSSFVNVKKIVRAAEDSARSERAATLSACVPT